MSIKREHEKTPLILICIYIHETKLKPAEYGGKILIQLEIQQENKHHMSLALFFKTIENYR